MESALRSKVIGRETLSRNQIDRLLATGDSATYCLLAFNAALSDDDLEELYGRGDEEEVLGEYEIGRAHV